MSFKIINDRNAYNRNFLVKIEAEKITFSPYFTD